MRWLIVVLMSLLSSAAYAAGEGPSSHLVVNTCGASNIYNAFVGKYRMPTVDRYGITCTTAGGGGGGGAVYGPDADGATPTNSAILNGFVGSDGKVHSVSPTYALPVADAGVGTPSDSQAAVGGNGSAVAQLKRQVTQLDTQITRLTSILSALGSPFQAGGSIGNTAFGLLYGGSPVALSNPVPTILPPSSGSQTTTAASNLVIKSSAGSLCGLNVVTGASSGYVMLFDATAAPADGAVTPKWVLTIAANTAYSGTPSGSDACMAFGTGITAVFSTTGPFTKTASATAFIHGEAR